MDFAKINRILEAREQSGRIRSFVWYDLETFGVNPAYDRICQFACIRTDTELNEIEPPVVLYVKPPADYVPSLEASLKTGISPLYAMENGVPEAEAINTINNIFSVPGTCIAGFNSSAFDDEFIRNSLYRNFLDPYRWFWDGGNSTMDVLTLARACHDLRPDGIIWPENEENGNPVLRLEVLTRANGIDHENAHDALSDVRATIALARLIREKQRALFDYYLEFKFKQNLYECFQHGPDVEKNIVLYQQFNFTSPSGCTRALYPLCEDPADRNLMICFNLSYDTRDLLSAVDRVSRMDKSAELKGIVSTPDAQGLCDEGSCGEGSDGGSTDGCFNSGSGNDSVKDSEKNSEKSGFSHTYYSALDKIPGVIGVRINKTPFISPVSVLRGDEDWKRLALDRSVSVERGGMLDKRLFDIRRFVLTLKKTEIEPRTDDPDLTLYADSFPSNIDKTLFTIVRNTDKEKLTDLDLKFENKKYNTLLNRYICRNYLEYASLAHVSGWKKHVRRSLLCPPLRPERDVLFLMKSAREAFLSAKTTKKDRQVCREMLDYCKELCMFAGIRTED